MSKTKMRCNTCNKWFQSANAKEITCPDCIQKARKEKLAAKTQPPQQSTPAGQATPRPVAPPPRPKTDGSGTSHWLDSLNDVKVGEPEQPPPRPKLPTSSAPRDNRGDSERGGFRDRDRERERGPGNYRDRDERGPGAGNYRDREGNTRGPGTYREREGGYRGPGGYRENDYRNPGPGGYRDSGYRVGGGMGIPGTAGPRPRQPMDGGPIRERERGPHPDKFHPGAGPGGKPKGQKPPKPPTPPKPKKEKTPPPPPFVPTAEQVTQVENRYLELATPAEFDGIRTQIAKELSIPKTAVKKIVKELRDRQNIPSWWELETYKGNEEELAKIKEVYEPMLPLPPVGAHKQIGEQLSIKPGVVYQAIKAIRQEMKLPQYNDPVLHGLETLPARTSRKKPVEDEADKADTEKGETSTELPFEPQEDTPATPAQNNAELQPESRSNGNTATQNNAELQSESQGEITSIETDTAFHREGDTIEIGATSATGAVGEAGSTPTADENKADEAQ
jgi:hypothetical protein